MSEEQPAQSNSLFRGVDLVDRGVYAVEKGIVTFSLLILAVTYFFEILYGELRRADHALDRVICRFAGYSRVSEAPEEFQAWVHDSISPIVGLILLFVFSYLAVVIRDRDRQYGWKGKLGWTAFSMAGAYGLLWALANVASKYVVCSTLALGLLAFGYKSFRKSLNAGILYTAIWLPIGIFLCSFSLDLEQGYAWNTELGKVMIMWVGFFGASMATRDKRHIRIDFVRKSLGADKQEKYNAWSYVVTLVFLGALTVMSIYYFQVRVELDCMDGFPGSCHELDTIPIPTWLVVAPLPLAFLLMMARFSGRLVLALRGEEGELGGEVDVPGPDATEGDSA